MLKILVFVKLVQIDCIITTNAIINNSTSAFQNRLNQIEKAELDKEQSKDIVQLKKDVEEIKETLEKIEDKLYGR